MELKKPRATAQETRNFILKDLTDAINVLPAKQAPAENGRATKGAAYALRGKVYLYNKQYDLAAKDFEEIVLDPSGKGYGYQLYPDYAGLFLPGGDESSEMIFAIQTYSEVGFLAGMPYAHYMGSNATLGTSWNNVMPSVELVDSYETKDGHPFNWDNYIPGYNGSNTVREETLKATLSADFKTVAAYPKNKAKLLAMYLKADGDYTRIYTEETSFLSSFGISVIAQKFDPAKFVRIHRSVIINLDYVQELYRDIGKTYLVLDNGLEFNIGRSYLPVIKSFIV